MPFMIKHDWLRNYADFDFTCKAVAGLGQRLSGPIGLLNSSLGCKATIVYWKRIIIRYGQR